MRPTRGVHLSRRWSEAITLRLFCGVSRRQRTDLDRIALQRPRCDPRNRRVRAAASLAAAASWISRGRNRCGSPAHRKNGFAPEWTLRTCLLLPHGTNSRPLTVANSNFGKTLSMIPNPLRAVIFDMDGLLLDTEVLYRAASFAACAAQGHQMVDHVRHGLIGTPKDSGDSKLIAHFGSTFDLERYHLAFTEHFEGLCATEVPLRPGVMDLLKVLRDAAIPMAIATSAARPRSEDHLKRAGILHNFDVLVTRSDVETGKPHPETFLKAAALLGIDPSNCLALEDSHHGIRAAAAAGMATIMIPDLLHPTPEIASLCVGVLPSLNEVRIRISQQL